MDGGLDLPLDFDPSYPGPPMNNYGGVPPQPGFQPPPYSIPYPAGPAPGMYAPQYPNMQPGAQPMAPGMYGPQYPSMQPGAQPMAPGTYGPQYPNMQPGAQPMAPAPYAPAPLNPIAKQPEPVEVETTSKAGKAKAKSGGDKKQNSCPPCCLKTRNCLMSPECGRGLQIASVVAMCGMCIRFFVCK